MKHTNKQTSSKTLTDLLRALDHKQPVTATLLKEEKNEAGKKTGALVETTRTLEIFDIRTTNAGHIIIKAMDRQTGEARTVRLDRILTYTTHRTTYTIERPTDDTPTPAAPTHSIAALIAYEINRDTIAAAYRKHSALAA